METKRIKAKVIMLPTENKQDNIPLHLGVDGKLRCNYSNIYANVLFEKAQHLYFTTNDEIKEGDYFINTKQNIIYKHDVINYNVSKDYLKKVVATTDKSLGLPQPSQVFIKKYCELGGIDEVDIELKSSDLDYFFGDLKVDPIHNTVTIHSIKDSWSREELDSILEKALCSVDGCGCGEADEIVKLIKINL